MIDPKIFDTTSYYYQAVVNFAENAGTDRYISQTKIYETAKKNPQFHYGEIEFAHFSNEYKEEGKIKRKVFAIPLALCSGLVYSIYHLAQAIFLGIPKAHSLGNRHYLTAKLFSVVRDLQIALGWLISLVDDARGLYLVQNGQFNSKCYDAFQDYNPNLPPNHAREISLLDYKRKSEDERKDLCTRLVGLNDAITTHEESRQKESFDLTKFLNETPDGVLEGLTLADLIVPYRYSNLPCVCKTEIETGQHSLRSFNGLTEDQEKFLKKRMKNEMERLHQKGNINSIDIGSPLTDTFQIKKEDIAANLDKIDSKAFRWFSNEQINGLKLSQLYTAQASNLFFLLEGEEIRKRLKLFSDSDILQAIYDEKFPQHVLRYLTISQKEQVDFSRINGHYIYELFSYDSKFLNQRIFSKCMSMQYKQVHDALTSRNLHGQYILSCLSPAQLKHIPLKDLPALSISEMFAYDSWNKEEKIDAKMRFASFWPHDVQTALENELLNEKVMSLLSPEQYKGLKLSKLSQETIDCLFPVSFNKDENAQIVNNLSYVDKEEIKACQEAGNLSDRVKNLLKRL